MAESLVPSRRKDSFLLLDIWGERMMDLDFSGNKITTVLAEFLLHRPLSMPNTGKANLCLCILCHLCYRSYFYRSSLSYSVLIQLVFVFLLK